MPIVAFDPLPLNSVAQTDSVSSLLTMLSSRSVNPCFAYTLYSLPSASCSVLSDRCAESGEHYFCVFKMKPRFGDEYKIGFHILYHSFKLIEFVV